MATQYSATYDAADLEPISTAASPESLQRIMDTSRAAAEAQRELEEAGVDPTSPAEEEKPTETPASTEPPAESPADKPAEQAPESTEESPEAEEPEEPPEPKAEEPKSKPGEPTYSRRDAARFAEELKTAKAELQQTRAEFNARQASDASIIQSIQQQAGSDQEYMQLRDKVRRTEDEQQRYELMVEWRKVAGPIFGVAQKQMANFMVGAWQAAAKFDGMDD